MEEEDFKTIMTEMVLDCYKVCKTQVTYFQSQLLPIEEMRELGCKIDNKSDFVKGYAVCAFINAIITLEKSTLEKANMLPLSDDKKEFLDDLQAEYSNKLTVDFDNG